MMTLRIRPSGILKFEDCPYAYHLQYVLGWRKEAVSANLVFGTAVHEAITSWLMDCAMGRDEQDVEPVERFRVAWEREVSNSERSPVEFSSRFTPQEMLETGEAITREFPAVWRKMEFIPLFDEDGPLIERRFEVEIAEGVVLTGQPDFVGMRPTGGTVIIDFKTPSSESSEDFALLSDQLTAYQILVEASVEYYGSLRLGFMDLLKKKVPKNGRGVGPQVREPNLVPRRDKARVLEFQQKVQWIAEDIQRGRTPRTPRMAWNSPCDMCDFRGLCSKGSIDGLVDAKGQPIKTIPIALAA
jgi:hypothetical protein